MYESGMNGSRIVSGEGRGTARPVCVWGGGAPPDLCGSNLGGSSLRPGVFFEISDDLSSYCFRA